MEIPTKLPFSKRKLRPRVIFSYIFDYVLIVICVVGFWILDKIEPFHQHFSLQNISLQYPFAVHERIPIYLAVCISACFPIVLIIVYTLFIDGLFSHHKQDPASGKRKMLGPWRWKDRLWELNCGILGLLLSQSLAFVITQVLKNACGKPRPDLIDRCQPRPGSHDLLVYGLSNSTICTGDPKLIKDGFRSWPSGHSSSSFAGLFYTSLWLGGKLHIMDNRGEAWKSFLVMVPILAATLIAVSRIMDARHHPFDVITGSLLGIACAIVSYSQYFPPLSEAWRKGRAYPIRTWGTEPAHPADPGLGEFTNNSTSALRNPEQDRLTPAGGPERSTSPLGRLMPPAAPGHPAASNPFNPPAYPRRRHDQDPDGNWSSSEDDVGNGYEMQHGYAMAQNPGMPGGYSSAAGAPTAYSSQTAAAGMGVPTAYQGAGNPPNRGRHLTDAPMRDL
ncbi:Uncharacterized protein PECH_001355 [Penicillium ucsense]|uniref:Phosphatidic acid phosphatase type 2/haloperoxidase domain-containing protein n=1 Tax=Penicillium ucsense TaxID=2839758 RepID=A0A8J8WGS3_9EURO|nr:Uncharacterized protein PECM_008315 [Penicillium ucsense]KAF7732929.1 Uncharacterized protein PECH_001355 [Penicillium ucsense]